MNRIGFASWAIAATLLALPAPAQANLSEALAELEAHRRVRVDGEPVPYRRELLEFYRRRGMQPAWLDYGLPGRQAWQLLDGIARCGEDGLEPADYHHAALDSLLRQFWRRIFRQGRVDSAARAATEILLTHAFLEMGNHLAITWRSCGDAEGSEAGR